MTGLVPLLLIGVVAAAVLVLAVLQGRSRDETRRIRRGLKAILGTDPHALITAPGKGRGAGFDFGRDVLAVTWDDGRWGLVYGLHELVGCELAVDGQVIGRVHRGETRRPVDRLGGAQSLVRLRLVFDDPANPDFDLDVWSAAAAGKASAEDAIDEANRWLARTESLLRRQITLRAPPVPPPAVAAPTPVAASLPFDDD